MSMVLSREGLLSGRDFRFEDVPVPELGEGAVVRVRIMTGAARDGLDAWLVVTNDEPALRMKRYRSLVCALGICNEAGELLFGEADVDELAARVSSDLVQRVFDAVARLNKLRPEDKEEAAKNSAGSQT